MSQEAELVVLGSCLCDAKAARTATILLRKDHFQEPRLRVLFEVIDELVKEQIGIDPITIWEYLDGEKRNAVTREFLLDICERVPTSLHVEHYAQIVLRDYFKTELTKLHVAAQSDPLDPDILKKIEKLWTEQAGLKNLFKDFEKGLDEYLAILEERMKGNFPQILTGYSAYDNFTGGHKPGQLITIGARTSRGKTAFLLCLSERFLMRGRRVLFFSAEMSYEELVDRMLSVRTKIPLGAIRGQIQRKDMAKMVSACEEIYKKPMYINDSARLSIAGIRAGIEACKPDVVMVDYIQRFIPPNGDNRAAYFSNVANELKALAREKGVVVFASSQLSRTIEENGKERRPTLADLKESGGIEEASDTVILLHSKNADDNIQTRLFDFIFAKQRNGPLGSVKFIFLKSTVSFQEFSEEEATI